MDGFEVRGSGRCVVSKSEGVVDEGSGRSRSGRLRKQYMVGAAHGWRVKLT